MCKQNDRAHIYLLELKNSQWKFEQLHYFVQSPELKSSINYFDSKKYWEMFAFLVMEKGGEHWNGNDAVVHAARILGGSTQEYIDNP